MHSGTTLLLRILANHPEVFAAAGETKFFERLRSIRAQFPDLADAAKREQFLDWVSKVLTLGYNPVHKGDPSADMRILDESQLREATRATQGIEDHRHAFRIVFEQLALLAGKSRCLEKTPTHVFHVDEILECMPDARLVHIVRDARDILASKKTRRSTVWTSNRYTAEERPKKSLEKAFHPVWDALSWKAAVRAGQKAAEQYPTQVHMLRYEDLVVDPDAEIRQCCEFLGISFDTSLMDVATLNPAEHDANEAGISAASVGRWKRVLSPAEVVACQRVAGSELARLGYELQPHHRVAHLASNWCFITCVTEFGSRLFRKWRLGGSRYLINVLANYWSRLRKLTTPGPRRDACRES
jgi:hypothetical protein